MNIVGNKTMRGDHMIMLAVLSAASMLMLYYGSLMTPTEVYLQISPSTLRHSRPEPEVTTTTTLAPKLRADANICCQAETPICKACQEGISVEEYLEKEKPISHADKNRLNNWYRTMTRIGTPLPKYEDINGGTIIDVGANVGVFSYNVRKICKNCRIMAFEAVPLFAKYIKTRNIGNIDVYPFGLSDKTGEADFWMSKDGNYGWNTMIPKEGGRKDMKKMKMKFKVFDDLNIDVGNLKLIKIDTEGAEYKVLRGLNKVIQKYKPKMLIEFGFGKRHPAYTQVMNEFDKLIDMGYSCNLNYKNVRGTTDLVFEKKNTDSIMIAIPTYNRIGYTKFHAKVIREYHKIPSSSLYIFDDCSTEYGEKELREWYGKDIHFFPCKKRLRSDGNIRRMFEYFITTNFDLIFSVDTDLIFHKNWRDFIYKHIDSTDGVMSLYHSGAPHHTTFNCNGELCEKKSMGSAGTVMKKSVVKKMLQEHRSSMFDWGFVSIFKRRKIKMMIPRKSLIMHYGQIGQNNACGTKEVAKGFDRSILPTWIKNNLKLYYDKCKHPSENKGKTVTFHGQTFRVIPNVAGWWNTISKNKWEASTFSVMKQFIDKQTIYIGFGTWIGPMLLYAGRLASHAYGFEPDIYAYNECKQNIDLNLDLPITLTKDCISNKIETLEMQGIGGSGSVINTDVTNGRYVRLNRFKKWKVQCKPLWETVKIRKTGKVFIKMDAEGAEAIILPSLNKWLETFTYKPTMLISFHGTATDTIKKDIKNVLKKYRYFRLVATGGSFENKKMQTVECWKLEDTEYLNTIPDFGDILVSDKLPSCQDPHSLSNKGFWEHKFETQINNLESSSGYGSYLSATKTTRKIITSLLNDLNIKSIVDLPCGDWNWMKEIDLTNKDYTGMDISKKLIERNKKLYGNKFQFHDIVNMRLNKKADLIINRDMLFHITPDDAVKAINNFKASGSTYFLSSTFPKTTKNVGLNNGWYPINLEIPPFDKLLGEPIKVIDERVNTAPGRHLGLWKFNTNKQKLWLIWHGINRPFMYDVALKSMQKLYECEIFKVTDESVHNIITQLTEIHDIDIWKGFIAKIKNSKWGPGVHYADFLRVALIYLYGGIYSDFDSLWIKRLPDFKLLMVDKPSNGVLGGYAKNKWLYNVLKSMPIIYDPNSWNSIGAGLLKKSLPQNTDEFTFIKYEEMYTIPWTQAKNYYTKPYNQLAPVKLGYQLHMFGMRLKLNGIYNSIPVENSLYANVIKDIGIDLCKTHPSGIVWDIFHNIITILNTLNAPYNLHGGTLLSWYRDCSLGSQDIDITLELDWFTQNNNKLKRKLLDNRWRVIKRFGTIGKAGYEEAWVKNNIKVDLFSQTLLNGKYTNGLSIGNVIYPCSIQKSGTLIYKWSDLNIKVPVPIEKALKSLYHDWKIPAKKYVWSIDPFKKGNQCTKNFTLSI